MEKFSIQKYDELFKSVLSLKSVAECRKFFEDVCTIKELEDLSQRLQVAELLSDGKNYNEIMRITGASTATISRVNKCLNYGKGGYALVLKRRSEQND